MAEARLTEAREAKRRLEQRKHKEAEDTKLMAQQDAVLAAAHAETAAVERRSCALQGVIVCCSVL